MRSSTTTTTKASKLPPEFVDCHHHFLDPTTNPFQSFLGSLVSESYLPSDYHRDVVEPLHKAGVRMVGSVHVECMPDSGLAEAEWVDTLAAMDATTGTTVKAIVASCDLAQDTATVDDELSKLVAVSHRVKGIRWILDYDEGPFDGGKNPTHVAVTRHNGPKQRPGDYLRGNPDGHVLDEWEQGFALLEKHGLSFDLQCAPAQLPAAAALFARHPRIAVVIDHLGKPRKVIKADGSLDTAELEKWRIGMQAMARLPNVYVKISMLGWAVPGWCRGGRKDVVRDLVRQVVNMFGAERCMVGLNWWKDGATSDADGLSDIGPSAVEFIDYCANYFFDDLSDDDRRQLFSETARRFYRLE